jgi:hypothetical protein
VHDALIYKVDTCSVIREVAFESHPKCYLDSGICELSVHDMSLIVKTVGIRQLLSSYLSLKQSVVVASDCLLRIILSWTPAMAEIA